MKKKNIAQLVGLVSCVVLLGMSGCKTTSTPVVGEAVNSMRGMHDETEARLSTLAAQAAAEGKTQEALHRYEKLYYNPGAEGVQWPNYRNEDVALNYAQLLRKTGSPQKAYEVLAPLAVDRTGNPQRTTTPLVLNEYAAICIELGELKKAEKALNWVLEDSKAKSAHADAYNLLGVVQDAQGNHKEAEGYFRRSLTMWKGDSTSVMNNLAVSLASQGRFDDSIMTLRQALMASPQKREVARNIELVSQLRQSMLPKPTPTAPVNVKPKAAPSAPEGIVVAPAPAPAPAPSNEPLPVMKQPPVAPAPMGMKFNN